MTNEQLESTLAKLVIEERRVSSEILPLILLAEDRKLYLERGFDSLIAWLIGTYKYSETAAHRRVASARMLRAVPEVAEKIESGEVSLTTLAKAQAVLRAEEKRAGEKVSDEKKAEVVEAIEGQSLAEAERTLAEIFPETMEQVNQQKVRLVANDEVRVSLTLDRETYELILETQKKLGHALPDADLAQVIAHVFRKHNQPVAQRKTAAESKAATRREVFRRDEGKCQYVDPKTKKKCGSKTRVEIDHIQPRALGGSDDPSNLRCLCRAHNAYRAEQTFGQRGQT